MKIYQQACLNILFRKNLFLWSQQGIVKELANYLLLQDSELKSFSARNLWRMKQFYETYKTVHTVYTIKLDP
ncbi:hypothetical protein KAJ27_05265 [bacterium]|nr:hypothetical protein [bacterium]